MSLFKQLFNIGVKCEGVSNNINEKDMQTNNVNIKCTSLFIVDDVFTITGKGTVVTGKVVKGTFRLNDPVFINNKLSSEIIGIEMFRKTLDYVVEGDNAGLILKEISKDMVHPNDQIIKK